MNSLIQTQDGSHSVVSELFGETYHSRYGALTESMHVFINGGLLPLAGQVSPIRILEYGFGTGLNALLSYQFAVEKNVPVHYTALEGYPIAHEQVHQLNYSEQLNQEELKEVLVAMHTGKWEDVHELHPDFHFCCHHTRFEDWDAPQEHFDLIFYDAFAPNAQPELWEPPVLEQTFQSLKPGGVLVTYCAKGVFKRTLKSIGYTVEAMPGPPGKREMTKAIRPLV